MIEEIKDIAEANEWPYHIFETEFPPNSIGKKKYNDDIYGIFFTPPECETVDLCFLSNGRMSSGINLKFWGNSKKKEEQGYLYMLSVKTQFAGIEIHKLIIHLLKYLSKKYFLDFKVTDEGHYWETGDEKLLAKTFGEYNAFFDEVTTAVETFPMKAGETIEEYFQRILKPKGRKG